MKRNMTQVIAAAMAVLISAVLFGGCSSGSESADTYDTKAVTSEVTRKMFGIQTAAETTTAVTTKSLIEETEKPEEAVIASMDAFSEVTVYGETVNLPCIAADLPDIFTVSLIDGKAQLTGGIYVLGYVIYMSDTPDIENDLIYGLDLDKSVCSFNCANITNDTSRTGVRRMLQDNAVVESGNDMDYYYFEDGIVVNDHYENWFGFMFYD